MKQRLSYLVEQTISLRGTGHVESCTWPLAEFVVMCVGFLKCVLLGIKYVVTPAGTSWHFVRDVCNCFIMNFVCIRTGPEVELVKV